MSNPMPVEFYNGYVTAALWTSYDTEKEIESFLDDGYDTADIHADARAKMFNECDLFWHANSEKLSAAANEIGYDASRAGHDFWLTRNGHGTGFWDRAELGEVLGLELSELAGATGSRMLYMGDDGMLHYCEG